MKSISAFLLFYVTFGSLILCGQRNTLQLVPEENLASAPLNAQANHCFKRQQNDQYTSCVLDYAGQAIAGSHVALSRFINHSGQHYSVQTVRPAYHRVTTMADFLKLKRF